MIAPMNTVPQNSGTAPKPVAWPSTTLSDGFQSSPNRNSNGETMPKKRIVSKISEATMPSVARIAISEASSRPNITVRSTWVRARKSGRMRVKAKAPPAKHSRKAASAPIIAYLLSAAS